MEIINYTNFELDSNIYSKNEISGVFDKQGEFLEKTIYDIRNLDLNPNMRVGWYLKFKTHNRELTQTLLNELEIKKELEKRPMKKLSTTEKLKIELILVLSSNAKTVIINGIDVYFNDQDFLKIIKVLKAHKNDINKTIIIESNRPENILNTEKYIVINDTSIIYNGKDIHKVPFKTETIVFADLANKKGAKLDYYKEPSDLLKAIYRSVK